MEPLLNLRSYGRRAHLPRDHFSPSQVARIVRTVRRAPEVMVKVTGGATSLRGAMAHIGYLNRKGTLDVELDDGIHMRTQGSAAHLADDMQLDVDELLANDPCRNAPGRKTNKLTHHVVLSMPAGTPADGVLAAARGFAREEFAMKHRYALVLHTDQDHPHVHLVVRAMGEDGKRLNIKKQTLRDWRERFAEQLRGQGIDANATSALTRGKLSDHQRDGVYRSAKRGESTVQWEREKRVRAEVQSGRDPPNRSWAFQLRDDVQIGWGVVARVLERMGQESLAREVDRFRWDIRAQRTRHDREVMAVENAAPARQPREQEWSR
jgi:hypothetical protein